MAIDSSGGGKLRLVDLFSGCGGFSLGAHLAGFETITAIDNDPILTSSYAENFPGKTPLLLDLATVNLNELAGFGASAPPDGVIGGPPCQGFSEIGSRSADDPRNALVWHFFRHVAVLKPRFFIMENVTGMLFDRNRSHLDESLSQVSGSYDIYGPFVVDAAVLGAPTRRRRAIVVGIRDDESHNFEGFAFRPTKDRRLTLVQDAISDLVGAECLEGASGSQTWWRYPHAEALSPYARWARAQPGDGLGSSLTRVRLNEGLLAGHRIVRHSSRVRARFADVAPGTFDPVGRHYRLEWAGLCPTLRAGTGKDRGSFQSVRPIHPSEDRVITAREAARLQGFPDWFLFHHTTWHSFRMIGNSVSPFVAKAVLEDVASSLPAR